MKINVLQLIGSFHTGGSERQAVQLVKLLDKREDCRVFPVCLNREGILREELEKIGYKEIPEFKLTSFYDINFAKQLKKFVRYLKENRIDVVQSSDFYTNIFGMTGAKLAGTKIRIAAKRETGTKTEAQRFMERRAFNFAKNIVVNAQAVRDSLVKSGVSEKKIVTIYNGLDLEKFSPQKSNRQEILREFNLPTDDKLKFVVIVANFRSRVKNQKMFLRAAKKTKEMFPDARFILSGEGELLNETKHFAAELDLQRETFFTGRCEDVPRLLSIADICVLSSTTEGFSNSILEYMAAEKPVVATNVGGASEAVAEGETGFLVDSDDDEKMAQRFIELLKTPEKAIEMGKDGRKIIEEKFSTKARLEKNFALYR